VDNADFPVPDGGVTVYQGRNPMSDAVAEKAVVLCGQFLRRAVRDGSDLEAREGMALAATLGGLAFSNAGVALVHALEYPVGGVTHCSHGAGNGLLLPFVMRFNLPTRRREFARLAALLGEDVAGLSEAEAAERAVAAVERLRADIGIPTRLRELGLDGTHLPSLAEKAFAIQRLQRVNPRRYTRDDLEGILRAAW
jgi:alcohol dehydrogenase class IV